ncbi:hypothetical protein, partial [Terrimonas pollutisoli]|uniref:hypothetical protein n=1 Tax=Terrimonas pollutisoli TaxID=3034147 RepID=UPI0023EC9B00
MLQVVKVELNIFAHRLKRYVLPDKKPGDDYRKKWQGILSCLRHSPEMVLKNWLKPLKTLDFDFCDGCPCCILEDVCTEEA